MGQQQPRLAAFSTSFAYANTQQRLPFNMISWLHLKGGMPRSRHLREKRRYRLRNESRNATAALPWKMSMEGKGGEVDLPSMIPTLNISAAVVATSFSSSSGARYLQTKRLNRAQQQQTCARGDAAARANTSHPLVPASLLSMVWRRENLLSPKSCDGFVKTKGGRKEMQ